MFFSNYCVIVKFFKIMLGLQGEKFMIQCFHIVLKVYIMEYYVNPASFRSAFTLPGDIADKHLKLASATQLKVIIYFFRHIASNKTADEMAEELRIPKSEIDDALLYWCNAGILVSKNAPEIPQITPEEKPKTTKKPITEMPTRRDVIRRAVEDERFAFLLQESQVKFGRLLKDNESRVLLWLYEDEGMDVSLILMLLEYAKKENKCTLGFIQRTAAEWMNKGVTTITAAEKYITEFYKQKNAWKIVRAAFGIDDRIPSSKELENSDKWVNSWGFDRAVLRLAYEQCVDTKSKFSMPYVAKILENWYNGGVKTEKDALIKIQKGNTKVKEESDFGRTKEELDLIEQIINKGYGEN